MPSASSWSPSIATLSIFRFRQRITNEEARFGGKAVVIDNIAASFTKPQTRDSLPREGYARLMIRKSLPFVLCLALCACSSKKKQETKEETPTETTQPEQQEPSTQPVQVATSPSLFDAAGYGGIASVAVWPEHWSKLDATAKAVIAKLPEEYRAQANKMREALLTREGPWKMISLLAEEVGLGKLPETIPGLDKTRPIIASLGRPLGDFEHLGHSLLAGNGPTFTGVQSRIVLPTEDSHAALSAIAKALLAADFKKLPSGEHEELLRSDSLVVRLQAAKLWLGVDVVSGTKLDELPMESLDDPTPKSGIDTLFTDGPAAAARLQLRYGKMEAAGGYLGMSMVARALEAVAANSRLPMYLEGYSEVLTMPVLMDPRGAVSSDGIFEIAASDKPLVQGVLALTKSGAAAFSAGMKAETPLAPPEVKWREIFRAAPMPPALVDADLEKVGEIMKRAGFAAIGYALGANILSILRVWEKAQGDKAPDAIAEALKSVPGLADMRLTLRDRYLAFTVLGEDSRFFSEKMAAVPEEVSGDAENCYRDVQSDLRKGLSAVGGAAGQAPGTKILLETLAKLETGLACAEKSDDLKDKVSIIRATIKMVDAKLKKLQ